MKYRPDLDGLRAVAVIAVIAFHAFPDWITGGFVGVDVFFVISGFLISGIILGNLEKGSFSYSEFYARRVLRIFPALLLLLAVSLAFGWVALLAQEYKQLGKHVAAGAAFMSNLAFWSEAGYFDTVSESKPLLHLWSLGVEEQFYLIWPVLLGVAWKKRLNIAALTLAVIVLSFAFNVVTIANDAAGAYYLPFGRLWQLLAGGMLAYGMTRRLPAIPGYMSVVGAFLIGVAVVALNRETLYPGAWALLPTVGTLLIIAAGPLAWLNRIVLSRSPMVGVGLISYPLYLWHWPLLSFARIIGGDTATLNLRLFLVALSFLLAWLTYRLVESPLRFGPASRQKVPLIAALMVAVGFTGAGAWYQNGLPSRHPEIEESLLNLVRITESTAECKKLIPIDGIRYCLISDPSRSPTIALVGDSHSNTMFPSLSQRYLSIGENLLQLGGGGCLPFWDIETGQIGEPNNCPAQMNPQLDYILQSSTIHTVIFSNRGPLHIEGTDLYHPGNYFIRNVRADRQLSNSDTYATALREAVRRFADAGKRVIVLIDPPELDFNPVDCLDLKRPLKWTSGPRRTDCRIPWTMAESRSSRYVDIVRSPEVLSQSTVLDMRGALCDGTYCDAMKDGQLMYTDPDHPSRLGAERIAKHLWPQLSESLTAPRKPDP